ncbi:hypothetical protein GUITHDRAFT_155088, partial [Guillardia theta CCMP2712]
DIRNLSQLVHSPDGGYYLYSNSLNQMFVHVPLTPTPYWSEMSAANIPLASTPNDGTYHSYYGSEHEAGFVSGTGGFNVGMVNGQ